MNISTKMLPKMNNLKNNRNQVDFLNALFAKAF